MLSVKLPESDSLAGNRSFASIRPEEDRTRVQAHGERLGRRSVVTQSSKPGPLMVNRTYHANGEKEAGPGSSYRAEDGRRKWKQGRRAIDSHVRREGSLRGNRGERGAGDSL